MVEKDAIQEFEEIDLREYIDVLIKRKKMICGIFLVTILVSIFVSFFILEPIYQSEATISLGTDSGAYSDNNAASQILQSSDYFNRINQKLELSLSQTELDSLRNNNLKIDNINEGIVRVAFDSKEAKRAKLVVNNLIKLFKEDSKRRFNRIKEMREDNIKDINQEIIDLEKRLHEREDKMNDLLTDEELSPINKIILNNDFSSKVQELGELKFSLMDKRYEIQENLTEMEPFRIINSPIISENPVKPNKKLNIAIAGILGLMIGIFGAFLLEFLEVDSDKSNLKL